MIHCTITFALSSHYKALSCSVAKSQSAQLYQLARVAPYCIRLKLRSSCDMRPIVFDLLCQSLKLVGTLTCSVCVDLDCVCMCVHRAHSMLRCAAFAPTSCAPIGLLYGERVTQLLYCVLLQLAQSTTSDDISLLF